MTLAEAKRKFRMENPNLRVNGWDERDYHLWSAIQQLPSYGLISGDIRNPMVSLKEVVRILGEQAEKRFEREWHERFGATGDKGAGK